jgi:hypothetical protein
MVDNPAKLSRVESMQIELSKENESLLKKLNQKFLLYGCISPTKVLNAFIQVGLTNALRFEKTDVNIEFVLQEMKRKESNK